MISIIHTVGRILSLTIIANTTIGINDNPSSLKSFGIKYKQIELIDDDFDYDSIKKVLESEFIKVIEIQRSKGYSTRESISISKVSKVIEFIKKISPNTIITFFIS